MHLETLVTLLVFWVSIFFHHYYFYIFFIETKLKKEDRTESIRSTVVGFFPIENSSNQVLTLSGVSSFNDIVITCKKLSNTLRYLSTVASVLFSVFRLRRYSFNISLDFLEPFHFYISNTFQMNSPHNLLSTTVFIKLDIETIVNQYFTL